MPIRVVLSYLIILFCFSNSRAQYTQIGNGAFTRTNIGPIVSDSSTSGYYSRMAYIWPEATLGDLTHGDSVMALSFKSFVFDSLRGTCNMKIFIKSTAQTDFGAGALNWAAESRNDMVLVYDDDPSSIIGDKPGYVPFIFNKVNAYRWDTTGEKKNLEVLIQFTQNTNQVEPIQWYVETNGTVTGFSSSNEGKFLYDSSSTGIDSLTNRQSIFKPTLRVHYPKHKKELEIQELYSLGRVPLLMKQADSIKVAIYNSGKEKVTNAQVVLNVGGANQYKDTVTISSLEPFHRKFVYFDTYKPVNQGVDSLKITLPSDGIVGNNEITKPVEVNYNVYSHTSPFLPNSGGIGFNGQTGDFVAKFYVQGTSYINQIRVEFSVSGQPFQLGIWDDDGPGGTPGTELFMSDTSFGSVGTYILPVLPRVKVSDGYFVGIRQASGTNVGFSFQFERPVRPNAFYFTAPAGDTNWTPFSPGFDFNVNIQPRLQVANDLAILGITSPQPNDTIRYSLTDSLSLEAEVINYGYLDQGLFIAKMEILNRFGQTVFSQNKFISLDAGDSTLVHFGKFALFNLGEFTARASITLNTDSVSDNNTAINTFYLVKDHDVGVDRFFAPSNNDEFALNKEAVFPTIRIANYGVVEQTNFDVVCELIGENGNIISRQVIPETLGPEGSSIISFDSMLVTEEGILTLRSYTELYRDSFPINDSFSVNIISIKQEDIEIKEIDIPLNGGKYAQGESLRPFVDFRNDGRISYDSVYFYATIYGANNTVLYTDTTVINSDFFSTGQVLFKPFDADSVGEYRFFVQGYIPGDQKRENDTMSSTFSVVTANDLQIISLHYPEVVNQLRNEQVEVELVVGNNGLNKALDANISLEITDNQNTTILAGTKSVTINPFSIDTISFGTIDMGIVGDYYVKALNLWQEEDSPNEQDSLVTTFIIRPGVDLALIKVTEPINNAALELNSDFKPSVQILSGGLVDLENIEVALYLEYPDNARTYRDTLRSEFLGAGRADLLMTKDVLKADVPGDYLLRFTSLYEDDFSVNDTLSSVFSVVLRDDIAVLSSSLPEVNDRLPSKQLHRPRVLIKNEGVNSYENTAVYCKVYAKGTLIYEDSRFVDILAGQSAEVAFDSTLTSQELTSATAEFISSAIDDQRTENDTLSVDFEFVQGASVSAIENIYTAIYPNPFTDHIIISSDGLVERISLRDLSGKIIVESQPNKSVVHLSLDLAPGAYMVELTIDGNIQQHSLIRTR